MFRFVVALLVIAAVTGKWLSNVPILVATVNLFNSALQLCFEHQFMLGMQALSSFLANNDGEIEKANVFLCGI